MRLFLLDNLLTIKLEYFLEDVKSLNNNFLALYGLAK